MRLRLEKMTVDRISYIGIEERRIVCFCACQAQKQTARLYRTALFKPKTKFMKSFFAQCLTNMKYGT